MGSKKNTEVSINTRKARMMDAKEMAFIQSVGDAADYERGREVRVYDSFSTRQQVATREEFVSRRRMLTPTEEWVIRQGYGQNPFSKHASPTERKTLFTVTYRDGKRKSFKSILEARGEMDLNPNAEKLWNNNTRSYEWAKDRKGVV